MPATFLEAFLLKKRHACAELDRSHELKLSTQEALERRSSWLKCTELLAKTYTRWQCHANARDIFSDLAQYPRLFELSCAQAKKIPREASLSHLDRVKEVLRRRQEALASCVSANVICLQSLEIQPEEVEDLQSRQNQMNRTRDLMDVLLRILSLFSEEDCQARGFSENYFERMSMYPGTSFVSSCSSMVAEGGRGSVVNALDYPTDIFLLAEPKAQEDCQQLRLRQLDLIRMLMLPPSFPSRSCRDRVSASLKEWPQPLLSPSFP
jgi:hypothetical protein